MTLNDTRIKAVFFDFMGTCLDWHGSVVDAFPPSIAKAEVSKLALQWRELYFESNTKRLQQNLEPEDINETLARTFQAVLDTFPDIKPHIDDKATTQILSAWHAQRAWPEVQKAIRAVQEDLGLETFVHANGTTRLQLNLTRSSGLRFNMLFSSELLGVYKPDPEAYYKALRLIKLEPEEVVMVAAHARDLRGAQRCGMKTIYINRWTDDIDEDVKKVEKEFNIFLEGMADLPAAIQRV